MASPGLRDEDTESGVRQRQTVDVSIWSAGAETSRSLRVKSDIQSKSPQNVLSDPVKCGEFCAIWCCFCLAGVKAPEARLMMA